MKIDMLGVQAFISIIEMGSFQRAATSLNLSQTALSHRLRKFEDRLGFQLLTRTTRRVALTPAGYYFAPKARRLVADAASYLEELRAVGERAQEFLTVGCLPTIAATLLPEVLREFGKRRPPITIKIIDRIAPDLTEFVRSGRAEIAFTVASTTLPDLDFRPLAKQRFVALCPADHALSRKASVSASNLVGVPLIRLGPSDAGRILIDEALERRSLRLTWAYEVQQMTTAIGLVASGMGIAIVPELSIDTRRLWRSEAVPLINPRISSAFGILSKRNIPLSPSADALIGIIRKSIGTRSGRPS